MSKSVNTGVMDAALLLWDFMQLREPLVPTDIILCLGSNDKTVAEYGAKLWLEGYAPLIVMSGGIAHTEDLAGTGWNESEAQVFAGIARACGVPDDAILLEENATNTGENFRLSRPLAERSLSRRLESAIVVSKPYMMRRGRATGEIGWPDVSLNMQAEDVSLKSYLERWSEPERIINLLVGDFQRIVEYPRRGLQTVQRIPKPVREAFLVLVANGFDRHLIQKVYTG